MSKVKFLKLATAFTACMLAMMVSSCDDDKNPKAPLLMCTPSKVEVGVGKTAVVNVSGGKTLFTATSGDAKIATAEVKEKEILIKGVKPGTTRVVVSNKDKRTGKIFVSVK